MELMVVCVWGRGAEGSIMRAIVCVRGTGRTNGGGGEYN